MYIFIMAERKNGSIFVALCSAVACAAVGTLTLVFRSHFDSGELLVDAISSYIFAGILMWWINSPENPEKGGSKHRYYLIFYPNRNFGIGNETVTMVITVLTALIAIFAFTDDMFK